MGWPPRLFALDTIVAAALWRDEMILYAFVVEVVTARLGEPISFCAGFAANDDGSVIASNANHTLRRGDIRQFFHCFEFFASGCRYFF